MALYHKWDVKNDCAYVLQFFSLISDSLDSVRDDRPAMYPHIKYFYKTNVNEITKRENLRNLIHSETYFLS